MQTQLSSRAPLSDYWSEACTDTDRPIGGEFIVHPGKVKQDDCLRICLNMGLCHPTTDTPCMDYTQLATLRSAEDAEVAAAVIGDQVAPLGGTEPLNLFPTTVLYTGPRIGACS